MANEMRALRLQRIANNIKLREVAEAVGVPYQVVSRLELVTRRPRPATVRRYEQALQAILEARGGRRNV